MAGSRFAAMAGELECTLYEVQEGRGVQPELDFPKATKAASAQSLFNDASRDAPVRPLLLDSSKCNFWTRSPKGKAGVKWDVLRTPPEEATRVLQARFGQQDVSGIIETNDYRTLFLTLSVKLSRPDQWQLSWARFAFDVAGAGLTIPSYGPTEQGVKMNIERTGSRAFTATIAGELTPSIAVESSAKAGDNVIKTTASTGGKVGPSASYEGKSGWKTTFDAQVDDVKGICEAHQGGGSLLTWDLYRNHASQVPENDLGTTMVAFATALIGSAKGSPAPTVNVEASGVTVRQGLPFRRPLEKADVGSFSLEPNL